MCSPRCVPREGAYTGRRTATRFIPPLLAVAVWLAPGCAGTGDQTSSDGPAVDPASGVAPSTPTALDSTARAFVFTCQDPTGEAFDFVIRHGEERLSLWLPPGLGEPYLELNRVPAASGARFETESVVVWNRGDEALLEVGARSFSGCALDANASVWEDAKLNGVDFRGVGNEPGWLVEIREGDRIRFLYDYGESETVAPAPTPTVDLDGARATYLTDSAGRRLVVVVEGRACTDAMSGISFPATVTVVLDDREFSGCGRALH